MAAFDTQGDGLVSLKEFFQTIRVCPTSCVCGGERHRNTARQAMDGLWTEVCGQQKQSNDPGNSQHILNTPTIGRR